MAQACPHSMYVCMYACMHVCICVCILQEVVKAHDCALLVMNDNAAAATNAPRDWKEEEEEEAFKDPQVRRRGK